MGADADTECHAIPLEFSRAERSALSGALNEVLYGLKVDDFEARIGTSRAVADRLLDELIELSRSLSRTSNQDAAPKPNRMSGDEHGETG
jgi:hypothetical protein